MGDIIQYNVRGLKSIQLRQNKISLILNFLADPSIKFVSIQETHLDDRKQIPK